MTLHKEGFRILVYLLASLLGANALMFIVLPEGSFFAIIFAGLSVIIYLFTLWFFRLPDRSLDQDNNIVIAPADGKVVAIEETEENEYFNERKLQVSIFMSPLNVHVNHFPVGGKVKYYKYHPGKYLVAWHPKSSSENERTTVVIENNNNVDILVRQIAGAVARRIICYADPGRKVRQGEELGFIRFGSRVDLFLPADVTIKVRPGQKVTGKETVIASFRPPVS